MAKYKEFFLTSKNIMLFSLLLYSCASHSLAKNSTSVVKPDFDINGVRLGDELSESFFKKHCPVKLKDSEEIECKKRVELDGIKLSIVYFFYKEKLLGLMVNYPSSNYNDLVNVYTKIFSQPPHSNISEKLLLNTDDQYINEKVSWDTTSGEFEISKYWNNLKTGAAIIVSSDYENYKAEKTGLLQEGFFKRMYRIYFE